MKKFWKLKMEQLRLVNSLIKKMSANSQLNENLLYIQHGTTSIFTHCKNVALVSLLIAQIFRLRVDRYSLVRGALLHDYFLYDWHDKIVCPHLHGYVHPKIALKNASKVFDLNETEKDIIVHHMFPLSIVPPKTLEGWLVTTADKLCGIYETFKFNEIHLKRRVKIFEKFIERLKSNRLKNNKNKLHLKKIPVYALSSVRNNSKI